MDASLLSLFRVFSFMPELMNFVCLHLITSLLLFLAHDNNNQGIIADCQAL